MSTRSHDDYKENIGAYVLGALPELEAEVLERHLMGCESCRAEVEELRPVASALARSVPQVEAPASLKASLMAVVNSEAEARAPRAIERPKRQRRTFAAWVGGLQPRTAFATGLAVLAVGIGVGIGIGIGQSGGGVTQKVIAAKIDRRLMPTGDARLDVSGSKAKLELTNAPAPPRNRVYQLWYQHGTTIERGGTFRPGPDGSYEASLSVAHTDAVMVTVERSGGAPAPTGPPIMQFNT